MTQEIVQIGGEPTGGRPEGEYEKSADEDLFHEASVCNLSEDEEESCHHEKIGDDDPGDATGVGIEVGGDCREGNVHNRTVKSVHNYPQRERP
ncbi:hypothetical protein JCM10550A_21200 [Methanogenium cariaci]